MPYVSRDHLLVVKELSLLASLQPGVLDSQVSHVLLRIIVMQLTRFTW